MTTWGDGGDGGERVSPEWSRQLDQSVADLLKAIGASQRRLSTSESAAFNRAPITDSQDRLTSRLEGRIGAVEHAVSRLEGRVHRLEERLDAQGAGDDDRSEEGRG
jgi:hypothetical protein